MLEQSEKDRIAQKLQELYNPNAIGEIEKYPPQGHYFVTLYFNAENSVTVENRYNNTIEKFGPKIYDFTISNVSKVGNELNISVRVEKQNI